MNLISIGNKNNENNHTNKSLTQPWTEGELDANDFFVDLLCQIINNNRVKIKIANIIFILQPKIDVAIIVRLVIGNNNLSNNAMKKQVILQSSPFPCFENCSITHLGTSFSFRWLYHLLLGFSACLSSCNFSIPFSSHIDPRSIWWLFLSVPDTAGRGLGPFGRPSIDLTTCGVIGNSLSLTTIRKGSTSRWSMMNTASDQSLIASNENQTKS